MFVEAAHFASSRQSATILLANFSICALLSFGRPPRWPFARHAAALRGDFTLPPRRPRIAAASETEIVIPKRLGVTRDWCKILAMPRTQHKLHEAMRTILLTQPQRTATLQQLFDKNVEHDLYRQDKGNGSHPPADQFRLRAKRYPKLFDFFPPDRVRLRTSEAAED